LIKDGLGCIEKEKEKLKFIFQSLETKKEIEIVPIGSEDKIVGGQRGIFQLLKGSSSSNCVSGDINMITLFVGNSNEFKKWSSNYVDFFEHFDSLHVNWCQYYKDNSN
jgi:hypothetical protein